MRKDKRCEQIINQNYAAIFRYCKWKLRGDVYAAEECTQEVFLLLIEKQDTLDLTLNITGWLHAAADRIVNRYQRQTAQRRSIEGESLEYAAALPAQTEPERSSVFDVLTDEEYTLLRRYYAQENGSRTELASALGISVNALYQRIHTIKSKLEQKGRK